MPLLIESVVSAAPSPVMKQPDGGSLLLKYRLISAFCVNTRCHRGVVSVAAGGVRHCNAGGLHAGSVGMGDSLAVFTTRSQRVWLAVLCGLLLALMLFLLPEYHRNIHQPLVEISLWASLGWWIVALLLVLFYPGSAAIWRNSKTLRLIFGVLTIVPFFWGHAGVTGPALRRESLQWRNMAALCHDLGMGR